MHDFVIATLMARESTRRRVSPKPVPRRRLVRPGS
jgi:hypothetical protein